MKFEPRGKFELVLCQALHQRNPAARGIPLVTGFEVGGTMGQAQTAFDTMIGLAINIFDVVQISNKL